MWHEVRQHPPLMVEIYGPEGSGKTHLACTFPNPVFLDTEGRSDWVLRKFGHTRLRRVRSWQDLREAARIILDHVPPPATVVVDSASDLQDWATSQWLEETGNERVWPRVNYGKIYAMLDGFIDIWRSSGYTLVFCERVKPEFDAISEKYTGRLVPDRYRNVPYKADIILELVHELSLDGHEITRPVARVHKSPWQPKHRTKPYLVELSYEAIIRDLSTPWKGLLADIAEEARRLAEQESLAVEAERIATAGA